MGLTKLGTDREGETLSLKQRLSRTGNGTNPNSSQPLSGSKLLFLPSLYHLMNPCSLLWSAQSRVCLDGGGGSAPNPDMGTDNTDSQADLGTSTIDPSSTDVLPDLTCLF